MFSDALAMGKHMVGAIGAAGRPADRLSES